MPKLFINKKFEFAASRDLKTEKAQFNFSSEKKSKFGQGRNYECYFSFSGNIDPKTSMVIELSELKDILKEEIILKVDHKHLNTDISEFKKKDPTNGNLSRYLYEKTEKSKKLKKFNLFSIHLVEGFGKEVTAYKNKIEFHYWTKILGPHPYRNNETLEHNIRITSNKDFSMYQINNTINELNDRFYSDKSNIKNFDQWVQKIHIYLNKKFTSTKIKIIYDDAFVEINNQETFITSIFHLLGTHRLYDNNLTKDENKKIFGKCIARHGHDFVIETTIPTNDFKNIEESLLELKKSNHILLNKWQFKAMDLEIKEFKSIVCTCENFLLVFESYLIKNGLTPKRLRIQETPNNRFTLRC